MAEVYGVKPKKFTREWWPYYWMYYKWHTILIGFFSICTIMFAVQCAMKVHYDLNVVYAGSGFYDSKITEKLAEKLSEVAVDADGNGKVNIWVEQINFTDNGASTELNYTMQAKHDVEMSIETYRLFLYDKAEAETMLGREDVDLMYAPVEDWAQSMPDEGKLLYGGENGVPYMVDLKDSKLLADIGMNASDLYLAVCRTGSEKELAKNAYEGAVRSANLLIFGE